MYELAAVVEGLLGAAAALELEYLGPVAEVVVYSDNQFAVDAAQPGHHSSDSLQKEGLDHIVPLAIEAWAAAEELAGRGAVVRVRRLAPRPHPYRLWPALVDRDPYLCVFFFVFQKLKKLKMTPSRGP